MSAALQEASAWLSKSGPQRWLLITDGELSSEGLEAVSERLSLLSQRADLSLGVALTSDAPLSASANTTLKALKALTPLTIASLSAWHKGGLLSWRQARSRSSQRATPHKSSPDEGLPPQLAEDGAARRLGLTRDDQPALPLAYGVARKGLKQGAQALLEVLAPQPYAPSAEHSTQEAAPLERRPLLVERPLGLGRVVELNASRWPLSAQLLRRLFVRSQPLIMTPWSFAWSSSQSSSPSAQPQGAQLLAYKPLSMDEPLPLIAHAWLSAPPPSLRLISGAWRPVLSNLSVFSAYDEADAVELPHNQDEDPPRFFELTTAHNTHPGLEPARLKLPLTLPQRFERPPLLHPADLKAHTSTLHREGRWLSVEESAAPSGELLDELSASASEPTPLPSELMWWLALLCLALELTRSTQTYKDA